MVNLQQLAPSVLLVGDVTPSSKLALASMRGVYTNLMVPPPLKVKELILMLGTNKLFPVLP